MRVKVIDSPIPEGYTYMRTDRFTPEEFVQEVNPRRRAIAQAWVKEHPKETYSMDDLMQFHADTSPALHRSHSEPRNHPAVSKTVDGYFASGRTTKRYSFNDDRY